MKLWSTTPRLKKLAASFTLVALAIVVATSAPLNVFAGPYEDKINSIKDQINTYSSEAERLRGSANSLQNALGALTAEKNAVQSQIELNEAKLVQLRADIVVNETKLERQKIAISKTVAQIYVNGSTSPIEMLASSKSIGEYVSAQEVRNSVRNQLKSAMDEVKRIKNQLEDQKKSVETLLSEQKNNRDVIAGKEQEQANLLAATQNEEAAYQGLIQDLEKQKTDAEAALARSLSNGSFRSAPAGPVSAGSIIGAIGNTGLSSGPHLHLEARVGGKVTDPTPYIQVQPVNPAVITQYYGNRDSLYISGYHPGTDYGAPSGAPISAIDGGQMYRGCSDQLLGTSGNPYGYVAIVEHRNGTISIYAHMSGAPAECNYNTYY